MSRKMVLGVFFFVILFVWGVQPVASLTVESTKQLYSLLPGGQQAMKANRLVLEKAKKLVAERQLLRRRRTVEFKNAIRFDKMNEKYISVAFNAQIKPRKPAIFSMLFEVSGLDKISYPNTYYLSWVTPNDLNEFSTLPINNLYKSYQKIGVKDCVRGLVRSGVEKSLMTKADVNHTHDASSLVSGVLPESVIPKSITRDSEMNRAVNGTITRLERRIAQLEKTVEKLTDLLDGVTRKNETIQFSNVNVQIVNGKGATHQTNGRGNLIVGYNEVGVSSKQTGSHNIVVGSKNSYASYGGVVTGLNNSIRGKYATSIGGNNNVASGDYSSITGGAKNKAKGKYSSIHGQKGRTKVGGKDNPHFIKKK